MSPTGLGAITVHCPLCGEGLRCPVVIVDDPSAMARNELPLELQMPPHVCDPGPDGDDGERAAA